MDAMARVAATRDLNGQPHMAPGLLPKDLCFAGCATSGEDKDWADAKKFNSYSSYDFFLSRYPNSKYASEARRLRDKLRPDTDDDPNPGPGPGRLTDDDLDWLRLSKIDTEEAYQLYLQLHKTGKYAEDARLKIKEKTQPKPVDPKNDVFRVNDNMAWNQMTSWEWNSRAVWENLRNVLKKTTISQIQSEANRGDNRAKALLGAAYNSTASSFGVSYNITLANQLYEQACNAREYAACTPLAYNTKYGKGVTTNVSRANQLNKLACDNSNAVACTNYGYNYANGVGLTTNYYTAAELYRKACDLGHAMGCRNLGSYYQSGTGVTKSAERAKQLYKQACDGGDKTGCDNYKKMTNVTPTPVNNKPWHTIPEADWNKNYLMTLLDRIWSRTNFNELKTAADSGDAKAATLLGLVYANSKYGQTVSNYNTHRYYKKGCDGGVYIACSILGYNYKYGKNGATTDINLANQYNEKACNGGNAHACTNQGYNYEKGEGYPKNEYRAAQLYKKACDIGHALGCRNQASMYDRGAGVTQNKYTARRLYQQACTGGDSSGCGSLGNYMYLGLGGAKDVNGGIAKLRDACRRNNTWSCNKLSSYGYSK